MPAQAAMNHHTPHSARLAKAPVAHGSHNLFGSLELMGAPMTFAKGVEIYGENEPADYVYKLVRGCVRTYKVLSDGRRQIGSFYLPGDIFGLEAGEDHSLSAEAITEATILVIRRSAVLSAAARDAEVARRLWTFTADELGRARAHVMLLVKSAQERVASFLLEMADRLAENTVELPMSRQDIADYLGLTIETVSRTLTQLENAAAIELPSSRRILLRNRKALSHLNA
jgi:CRP/FNR family nitrogen fixation transcriptional regulator